jgi:hypothetical protein
MIRGCLRNLLAGIGCGAFLLVGGGLTWHYRAQLTDGVRAFRGLPTAAETAAAVPEGPAGPSPESLRSARAKHERMSRSDGPEFIALSAAEMASLIRDGLDPIGQLAIDSIVVTLSPGRLTMDAALKTDVWGRDELGLLGGLLRPYEPLRVSGTGWILRTGVLAWQPDQFSVRSIPFPGPMIPSIVNRLTGGRDGNMLFGIPATIREARIEAHGVTFYRRVQ